MRIERGTRVRDAQGRHVGKVCAADETGFSVRHGLREVRLAYAQVKEVKGDEAWIDVTVRTIDDRGEGAVPGHGSPT
jgi:hypothetical protein